MWQRILRACIKDTPKDIRKIAHIPNWIVMTQTHTHTHGKGDGEREWERLCVCEKGTRRTVISSQLNVNHFAKFVCMQRQYNDYKWFYTFTWVLNIIFVSFKWCEELNFDFIMFWSCLSCAENWVLGDVYGCLASSGASCWCYCCCWCCCHSIKWANSIRMRCRYYGCLRFSSLRQIGCTVSNVILIECKPSTIVRAHDVCTIWNAKCIYD